MHASTVYTANDGASQSDRVNLQTGAILYISRGRRDQNPDHVRWNRQTDPRILDAHQAVSAGALRPTESRALPQDPNRKGRGNRDPLVWMQYVDPSQEHYTKLCTVHHRVLLRIIEAQRKRPAHRMTSYNRDLEVTGCKSIETTLQTKRILWAWTLIRISGGRLPKRIAIGNLEGGVRRGRGVKEKE